MSFSALAAIRDVEAPGPSALLLLFLLAEYAGADGCCYPSQKTLSDRSKLSERAVRDNLHALEEAGLIEQQRRNRKDGTRTSNRIRLAYYRPEEPDSAGGCEAGNPPAKSAGSLDRAASARPPARSAASLGKGEEDNRQLTTSQPAAVAGLTTFEPIREPITLSACERRSRSLEEDARERRSHGEAEAPQVLAGEWVAVPPEIRDQVVAIPQRGENWAAAWLDGCGFDPIGRRLIPPSGLAQSRIREALWRQLREWGVELAEPAPLAAIRRAIAGVHP